MLYTSNNIYNHYIFLIALFLGYKFFCHIFLVFPTQYQANWLINIFIYSKSRTVSVQTQIFIYICNNNNSFLFIFVYNISIRCIIIIIIFVISRRPPLRGDCVVNNFCPKDFGKSHFFFIFLYNYYNLVVTN